MEKSSKRRMSVKPTLESSQKLEKPKRRQSQMVKTKPNANDFPQTNPNYENQVQVQMMPPAAQIYPMPGQPIYYQPQYGQPMMMNGYSTNPMNTINNYQGMGNIQPMQANPYIQNQNTPVPYVPLRFGFEASKIVCPYCNQSCQTKIEESFNFCTCCTYIFIIILIPILIVLAAYSGCGNATCSNTCSNADCCDCNSSCCVCGPCKCDCCKDYNHYCSNCGKRVGGRDSFVELCPCFSCFSC